MKTSYLICEKLVDRLKAAERQTGKPMGDLIRAAIEAYLKGLGV